MAWYKIVMQQLLVLYHEITHLTLAFPWYTQEPLAPVYTMKIQVTCGIFHGIKPPVYTEKIQVICGILHAIHTHLKACMYTKKKQVTRRIFHDIPLESVA